MSAVWNIWLLVMLQPTTRRWKCLPSSIHIITHFDCNLQPAIVIRSYSYRHLLFCPYHFIHIVNIMPPILVFIIDHHLPSLLISYALEGVENVEGGGGG